MKRIEAKNDIFYTFNSIELFKMNVVCLLAGNFFTLVLMGIWVWVFN